MTQSPHYPEVGDVYLDKDWRSNNRQVRIVELISNASLKHPYARVENVDTGYKTRIRLDRLSTSRYVHVRHDHSAGRHKDEEQPDG